MTAAVTIRSRRTGVSAGAASGGAVAGQVRNPIDAFIAAKLAEKGLANSPEADRRTLIRRASFDLIGLPPTPEEVGGVRRRRIAGRLRKARRSAARLAALRRALGAALARCRALRRERRLRNESVRRESPGLIATTSSGRSTTTSPTISSCASNSPAMRSATTRPPASSSAAPWDQVKSPDPVLTAQQRADELHDMVSTTGSAFLGLTVSCARCHDHKFDPISQTDYYAMVARLRRRAARRAAAAPGRLLRNAGEALTKTSAPTSRRSRSSSPVPTLAPYAADVVLWMTRRTRRRRAARASRRPADHIRRPRRGQPDDPGDVTRLPNLGGATATGGRGRASAVFACTTEGHRPLSHLALVGRAGDARDDCALRPRRRWRSEQTRGDQKRDRQVEPPQVRRWHGRAAAEQERWSGFRRRRRA